MTYFGLFRIGELVCSRKTSNKALKKSNVTIASSENSTGYNQDKTNGATCVRIPLNEVTREFFLTLKSYMSMIPSSAVEFLCHSNGSPLTRYQFSAVLSKVCKVCSFNVENYKTRSFRIGRATDLALSGMSEEGIKQMGRWSSKAYTGYIRK